MQLSTKYGFAFLCMPKCASTSVENAISDHCNLSTGGHPSIKHINIRKYKAYIEALHMELLPKKKVETFCLMREPIEWLGSWYRYRSRKELENEKHPNHKNYTGNITFSEFLEEYLKDEKLPYAKVENQFQFVCLKDGSVGVDRIFKMEALDQVEAYLSDKIGEKIIIPRLNVSPEVAVDVDVGLCERVRDKLRKDYELYESL